MLKEAISGCEKLSNRLTVIQRNKESKALKEHKGGFNYYLSIFKDN